MPVPSAISTTLLVLSRVSIQQSGTHLWLFLAGTQAGGSASIEAAELDDKGRANPPLTTVIDALAGMTDLLVFAEGGGAVFAVTSPTTAGRQVQTFVFRTLAPVGPEVISTTASIQADAADRLERRRLPGGLERYRWNARLTLALGPG